jgi:hypothetical protein
MMPDCKALAEQLQLLVYELWVMRGEGYYAEAVAIELRRIADELEEKK